MTGINFLGSYSGIDSAAIDQLMEAEAAKLVQYTSQKETLTTQKNAWNDINTRLSALFERLNGLQNSETFNSKSTSSSMSGVVSLSAEASANNGSYEIAVQQLAASSKLLSGTIEVSAGKTINDELGLSGNLVISNQESSFEIEVSAEDSLKQIVENINKETKNSGISAAVIDQRIVLTDKQMGERSITVEGTVAADLGLDAGTAALNKGQSAILTVDGLTVTRNSNAINDVIDGVTIHLNGISAANTAAVTTVSDDNSKTVSAVKALIDQYNSVMNFIDEKLSVGDPSVEDNQTGELVGDLTLMRLQSDLRSLFTKSVDTGDSTIRSAVDIGISIDRYGVATLDEAEFNKALTENREAVETLFNGSVNVTEEKQGITQNMGAVVSKFITNSSGVIATKSDTYDRMIKDVNDRIDRFNIRLENKRAQYVKTFTRLDTAMMQAEAQLSYLLSQVGDSSSGT